MTRAGVGYILHHERGWQEVDRSESGLLPPEMKKLRQLEDENTRSKKTIANLTLDREMLQDVIRRTL